MAVEQKGLKMDCDMWFVIGMVVGMVLNWHAPAKREKYVDPLRVPSEED